MDATNRQIIAQLAAVAENYFNSLDLAPGTYTAAELAKNETKSPEGNKIPIYEAAKNDQPRNEEEELKRLYEWEPVCVAAGSFVAELPRCLVFRVLSQFEQLERVSAKEKTRFVRAKEGEAAMFVTIPKEAAALAGCVCTKEDCRPQMEQIWLDLENKCLVATNTKILRSCPVEVEMCGELPEGAQIYINAKHIKNLVGRCAVSVVVSPIIINGEETEQTETTITITNEAGEVYNCETPQMRFPDWLRVLPRSLSLGGYIRLTKTAVKTFVAFCKSAAKSRAKWSNTPVAFSVECGMKVAKLTFTPDGEKEGRSVELELCETAPLTITIGMEPKETLKPLSGWDGGLWFTQPHLPFLADCENSGVTLIMPCCIEAAKGGAEKGEISALERRAALPVVECTETKPKRARAQKKRQISEVAETPAPVVVEEKETAPTNEQIIAFVELLALIVDSFAKLVYRLEISKTINRLRELAELAGVDIAEVLADALPPVEMEQTESALIMETAPAVAVVEGAPVMETPPELLNIEEPRTEPAQFRSAPHAWEVVCGSPPGLLAHASEFATAPGTPPPNERPGGYSRAGSHKIRDGTNFVPGKLVNFALPKYIDTS